MKKRTQHILQRSILIVLIIIAILGIIRIKENFSIDVFGDSRYHMPILIVDAGHGGQDGGAVSSNGVSEAAINLCIAKKAYNLGAFLGFPCELTRKDENSLNFNSNLSIKKNKLNDLKERVRLCNTTKNSDVLSIHLNKFSDGRYFGAQVFHKNDSASILLAKILQENLYFIDIENTRVHKAIPNDNYFMDRINNVGVIAECGFLSNAKDERMLQTDSYQTKLALLLMSGYTNYKFNR